MTSEMVLIILESLVGTEPKIIIKLFSTEVCAYIMNIFDFTRI